jgi:glutathione peroxidase
MFLNSLLLFSFFLVPQRAAVPNSIYDFKVESLTGGEIDFSAYKGKKILIVNTASKCKFTHQYEALEKLYNDYKDNLVIVGFPSNNFLFEEPGDNKSIARFCSINYGVSFPMAAKISVKGRKKAPIYQWLTEQRYNGYKDSKVVWNFQKYLINEQGQLIAIFYPTTAPDDEQIKKAIER